MRLTPFGKKVRHLRIDADVTLKDMADALGVSSAYLSAVEVGRKPASEALAEKVARYFRKRGVEPGDLVEIALRDVKSIDVQNLEGRDKQLIAAFARRLPEMKDCERDRLSTFLGD
ncbi:helix-turn-helix domain-containing protein [Thioalkalivibrio sp. ALM2T]|uniref:helix-turn-helix domain-containing protein n=1 Tax=Thioalkalivibrio sp. ALM2T TaxID=1158184 RepID=UPI00036D9225|nr:helix-turn-helix transcriptional regulator [Thioalkalivibrio sp. ALM2T]